MGATQYRPGREIYSPILNENNEIEVISFVDVKEHIRQSLENHSNLGISFFDIRGFLDAEVSCILYGEGVRDLYQRLMKTPHNFDMFVTLGMPTYHAESTFNLASEMIKDKLRALLVFLPAGWPLERIKFQWIGPNEGVLLKENL